MTFAELQRGVFDDLQYQQQPKPGVQDRVRRYLNEGLERTLRRPRLKTLRHGKMPMSSFANQGFYGAPPILERIDYVIDTTTGRRLDFRTRDWYRGLDARVMTSGTPTYWIPEGISPVRRQPRMQIDSLTKVWARSEGPQDVTQRVFIRMSYAGPGNEFELWSTLQGTTPVLINSPPNGLAGPSEISAMYLDATALNAIYITDHDGPAYWDDFLAWITPGQFYNRYVGFRLYPTPSSAMLYEIEGQRVIPRMTRDGDTPPFPDDFHEMLQCYARGRMYRKDGRLAQAQQEFAEYERYCLDLTAAVEYPVGYKPVAGKLSTPSGWSNLGPWYPVDRGD